MTDEQWLWLFVNQIIDNEEHLEKMCTECKDAVTSDNRCIKCGKVLASKDEFINPNFDADRFERLSRGDGVKYEEDIDIGLMKQISKGGV